MANKMLTVFQNLDKVISGNWDADNVSKHNNNTYDLSSQNSGNNIIYKADNKADYDKTKLELQQNRYLNDRWVKANVNLSVQAFSGLNNVKLMYRDADLMDAFPEIGAALDIISEECSVLSPKGQIVNVYSKSDRIKNVLEELFTNRLDLQVTAPMIIRGMCKYGNQFMMLNIDNKLGITGWRQLPVFNVERLENGIRNQYSSYAVASNSSNNNDLSTKFVWQDEQNSQVPFRNWQIGHFRLLTDSLYLPYGCSYLNKARRHWRMLSLMEDMMLIYRLDRSIERRVYKIFVGAIDDADVKAYVEDIANNFKRTPIVDPMTGQLDLRKNILPVHKDTPIPLLDGRTISIEELSKEFNDGKENYVYSIQDGTHKVVPSKVVWCGKNYTADKLVKITLDDDTYIVMAEEHELIMRDGSKKRADCVSAGESVMPFYTKLDVNSEKLFDRYEKTYNPNSGKFEPTHRLVAYSLKKGDEKYNTVHHKDFNKYNNNPTNLLWCDYHEHHKMHSELAKEMWRDPIKRAEHCKHISEACKGKIIPQETREKISKILKEKYESGCLDHVKEKARKNLLKYLKSDACKEETYRRGKALGYRPDFKAYNESELHKQHNEIRRIANIERWKDEERRKIACYNMQIHFDNYVWDIIDSNVISGEIYNRKTLIDYVNNNLIDYLLGINKNNSKIQKNKSLTKPVFERLVKEKGYNTISDYLDYVCKEHNVQTAAKTYLQKKSEFSKQNNSIIYFKSERKNIVFSDDVWGEIRKSLITNRNYKINDLLKFINTNLIDVIRDDNKNIDFDTITLHVLKQQVKKIGFGSITDFMVSQRKNHKIKSIEYVDGEDVYCMTVVGLNGEEDRHNFAICSWNENKEYSRNGVFVSNCSDQDLFIPVRDPNAPTPIDTLSAAQNLTAMDDIKFVQNKVLTALRIPKSFLNFEETTGDGKNLSLMDIRFTRTVNRIQQAFLMELTKIASIHLYILGFTDELTNFSLSMNNPSTQAEQLEIDNIQKKITAIRDAVSDPGNGIPIMSQTRALKEIMKWSDKDIQNNLEEIRLEKAVATELEKTSQIIKKTGIFDTVDRVYGEPGAEYQEGQDMEGADDMSQAGGGGGGFGGGMDMGDIGDESDQTDTDVDALGDMGTDDASDISGNESEIPISDNEEPKNESKTSKKKPLNEGKEKLKEFFLERFNKRNETVVERTDVYDKALMINEDFNDIIKSLDNIKS